MKLITLHDFIHQRTKTNMVDYKNNTLVLVRDMMAAHTCSCALILLSLFTLGGFVSGSEYSSLTNYIYAGPKDMANDSNWHQFFDFSNSYLHCQQYIRSRKKAYSGRRALYYSNSTATTQLLLLKLSGNVESNPGPQGSDNNSSKTLCAYCAKAIRRNQNGVRCSTCLAVFHNKCTKMRKNELSYYRREGT